MSIGVSYYSAYSSRQKGNPFAIGSYEVASTEARRQAVEENHLAFQQLDETYFEHRANYHEMTFSGPFTTHTPPLLFIEDDDDDITVIHHVNHPGQTTVVVNKGDDD